MHIHHHQALGVLGQYVDAMQLGNGITQRRHLTGLGLGGQAGGRGSLAVQLTIGLSGSGQQGRIGTRHATRRRCGPAAAAASHRRLLQGHAGLPGKHPGLQTSCCRGAGTVLQPSLRQGLGGTGLAIRALIGQRPVQGAEQEVMHHAPITETHLVLGRVHVDVDHRRVQFEEQHKGRVATVEQHIPIGLAHRVGHQLVADHATIDTEILQIGLTAGEGRQTDPAPQAQTAALLIDGDGLLDEGRTEDARHPPLGFLFGMRWAQAQHRAAVVAQVEGHIETRQGQALDHLFQMAEFGFLGAQELAPGRGIEEQVPYFHGGALRVGSRLYPGVHVPPLGLHLPGLIGILGAGGEHQPGDRADRGQCLATKTQGGHPFQIIQIHDLAGGVTRQRQRQVTLDDATPVIPDPQQLDAALLHIDINPRGSGIQAVFQQFLDHRRRSFHHLTRGNLVSQARAQQLYSGHLQPHDHFRGHFSPTCCWPAP